MRGRLPRSSVPVGSGTFSANSNYAREARSVAASGEHYLSRPHRTTRTRAVVLDVDDTTLATWNYEVCSSMVGTVRAAEREGYAIFYLTGRPATQEQATLGNLTADGVGVDAGYPKPTTLRGGEDGLFTKPAVADYPAYLRAACAGDPNGSCTTVHYKSATRARIESLGHDIVATFGDQFSDLKGGYADRTFKLPNPNYFLP
jgi:predicted secreted acid phosphatase